MGRHLPAVVGACVAMLSGLFNQQGFVGVVFAGMCVYFLCKLIEHLWNRTHPQIGRIGRQNMPTLWMYVVGGAAVGLLLYFAVYHAPWRPVPDISWDFDDPTKRGQVNFIGMTSRGDEESRAWAFQAIARNNLDEPITEMCSYVRSDVTNAQHPVLMNVGGELYPIDQTMGIPPHAEFMINSPPFPSNDPAYTGGIGSRRFLVEWAPLTFVFEYHGKRFTRTFSVNEIRHVLDRFDASRNARRRTHGVRLKPKQ